MQTIQLPCFDITVTLTGDGGGSITSDLHDEIGDFYEDSVYNFGIDALESLILAHAVAGIDITTPAYIEGIETAVLALHNNV